MRRARSAPRPARIAGCIVVAAALCGGPATAAQAPQVKLVTPRLDQPLSDPIVVQALVRAVPGRSITRVVAFVDDVELGVRTRPPFRWVTPLPEAGSAIHVRVVVTDSTGTQAEIDELITRVPGMRFEAEVPVVSLNVAAVDDDERFVADLSAAELVVRDNGELQQILDFARAEAPLRVAILVDQSRSMADKMGETLAALAEFLAELGPDDQVKLMAFNDRVTSYTPFTNMHELVAAFAQGITPEGSTALYDAVLYGYRQLAGLDDARERRVIFLMTDGDDRASRTALQPAIDRVRNGGVTIFALGQGDALGDGDLRDVLLEMAEQTGGEAVFERDKDRLDAAFGRIAAAMRALYLVSYRPSDPHRGWHDIVVETTRPGLRLRHKPGYESSSREPGR